MATLSGTAQLESGAPAERVVVRDWNTHQHVAEVRPGDGGVWTVTVPAGTYDVTVIGPAGYQPVCEGPIQAAEN